MSTQQPPFVVLEGQRGWWEAGGRGAESQGRVAGEAGEQCARPGGPSTGDSRERAAAAGCTGARTGRGTCSAGARTGKLKPALYRKTAGHTKQGWPRLLRALTGADGPALGPGFDQAPSMRVPQCGRKREPICRCGWKKQSCGLLPVAEAAGRCGPSGGGLLCKSHNAGESGNLYGAVGRKNRAGGSSQ